MFFEGVNLPEIKSIFNKAKEERKKLLEELEKELPPEENNIEVDDVSFQNEEEGYLGTINSVEESESFEFNADNFKLSSISEDEFGEKDVNSLIQKGVSLYEVGDIENALTVWKQALEIQPDNEFLKEYIANAERELGLNGKNIEEKESAEEPEIENIKIEVEEEDEEVIFNEEELSGELKRAIAIARSGDVERAKSMLDTLFSEGLISESQYQKALKFTAKIEKEVGLTIMKNRIKTLVEEGEFDQALSYLNKNKNRFNNDEANRIEQYILQKKQEHSMSQSLELELDIEEEKSFNNRPQRAKKIEKREQPKIKKERKTKKSKNIKRLKTFLKTTFFLLFLLIIFSFAIFYGIKLIKTNIQTEENTVDIHSLQVQEIELQKEKNFKKYIKEAKQFFDMGDYMFAYYTLLHAERYGKLQDEHIALLSKARKLMKQEGFNKKRELILAKKFLGKNNCEKAIPHLKNILSENPEDLEIKEQLFKCYKKIAIKYALNNEVLKAQRYFNYALVLNRNDSEIPKHLRVLQRYLKGRINRKLLTEWFYFFNK